MTKTVELEVAQATLSELVAGLNVNEEVVIMKDHIPVAKLVAAPAGSATRVPGLCKGMITIVAEDDEHLKDFAEYMP